MDMSSRIVFFSSTEFGAKILERLIENCEEISLVVTRTDKVRKRGNKVTMTEVKKVALKHNIDVLERDSIDESAISKLREIEPDFFIVVAYGAILSEEVLDIPKISPINIHASLLPILRGASPIESAILEGHKETGISYMKMTKALDAGDVYKKFKVNIEDNETFDSLNLKLLKISMDTVSSVLDDIKNGLKPTPQEGESTYANKILKGDEIVNFKDSSLNVKNKINSLSTHIGAATFLDDNRYKIFNSSISNLYLNPGEIKTTKDEIFIGTNDKAVKISLIQAPGKKKMDAKSFLLGNRFEGILNEKVEK